MLPPALERIYKAPKWLGGEKVKHVIEPRIEYALVDGINNFNRILRFDETDIIPFGGSLEKLRTDPGSSNRGPSPFALEDAGS